jgi:hypothetical protein
VNNESDTYDMPELEPIRFRLVNGHFVKVEADLFWDEISEWDLNYGYRPKLYAAICIYCSEDVLPPRMIQQYEFVEDRDYRGSILPSIWTWTKEHVSGPALRDHDCLEDFLEVFSSTIAELSLSEEDAVDHYRNLPTLCSPEAFDRVDDSHFNDQNDLVDSDSEYQNY